MFHFVIPSAAQARYAFSGCNLLVSNGLLHGGLYRQVGEITVRKLCSLSGLLCVLSLHVLVCVL